MDIQMLHYEKIFNSNGEQCGHIIGTPRRVSPQNPVEDAEYTLTETGNCIVVGNKLYKQLKFKSRVSKKKLKRWYQMRTLKYYIENSIT